MNFHSPDRLTLELKSLTDDDKLQLERQNSRLVPAHQAIELERNARKHWDIFYKRNETRFFKDRRWTTREFEELLEADRDQNRKRLLEVGCGVGNLVFPLVEEKHNSYFIYACDFSSRAVDFVRQNPLYNEQNMNAFQCDITTNDIFQHIDRCSLDIITMVFVMSAIHPDNHGKVMRNLFQLLSPGGVLLFRDYGLYDMAQLRFKAGHKISENFYMRQDGTRYFLATIFVKSKYKQIMFSYCRSYYFTDTGLNDLAISTGFDVIANGYVNRRTINVKLNIDAPRIFLQCKLFKPKGNPKFDETRII